MGLTDVTVEAGLGYFLINTRPVDRLPGPSHHGVASLVTTV